MERSIVKIDHIWHRYATAWAVSDIVIDIKKRGIYGLLGSNGAGKSTLMNILCGALSQTRGDIFIEGINMRKQPVEAKKLIGFLPQTAPLYLDLTVTEYLVYCARLRRVPETAIPDALSEVLERCGITQVKGRLLKNLSGGYRQRVGIAQAIIHKPALVILDEPTNGLDPMQIIEVRKLIKEIAREHTVILSSHILSEIQLMCGYIVMIEQGKMVFSDSIDAFNNYIVPQSLLLEFEHAPVDQALLAIKGVNRCERLTDGIIRLYYDGSKEVSEELIIQSVQSGWRLRQLTIEKNAVDEIFKQLTSRN